MENKKMNSAVDDIRNSPEKQLIVDIDGTLTIHNTNRDYKDQLPRNDVIARINELHDYGVRIILYTARNMRTYNNNVGKINMITLPILINWLKEHNVKYDEIYTGKPWCGTKGFYLRRNGIRPKEFVNLPLEKLINILKREQ